MARRLEIMVESWPIDGSFAIARGSRTQAIVVVARIEEAGQTGRGECVPYARYGETVEGVVAAMEIAREAIETGADRWLLRDRLPAGAARNALDCALWDLEAKRAGLAAHALAGIDRLAPAVTAFTISLGPPEAMAAAARAASEADRPILKIKLGGGEGDPARIAAVREAAPDAVLLVDANEGWTRADVEMQFEACAGAGVALIEQPLPAAADEILATLPRPVPLCADESAHGLDQIERVAALYDAINIKLDKTGGLTEAFELARAAKARGLAIMAGCMVGTSLAMAPAMLLTPLARFVDLDGPLLLARDREPGLRYEGAIVYPPPRALWG